MQIQTLYYLEITKEDIQASKKYKAEDGSWCRSCPISQAMQRTLGEPCETTSNWTSTLRITRQYKTIFSGHNNCIQEFIQIADQHLDKVQPTILLLELEE